jgi:hypothetical protein
MPSVSVISRPARPSHPGQPSHAARSGLPGPRPRALDRPIPPVYGLDIETDTTTNGLDPQVARIVAVAVAAPDGVRVFDDADEALLLDRLDWHLASLDPGVVTTWNGAAFDLPFLADRARAAGMHLGLRLTLDPSIPGRREPLAGHAGAYRGSWHGHAHLDAYQVFRADVVPALGVSGGLKTIARLCGLNPLELPAASLHEHPKDQVSAYVASDAWCTRELVCRRWATARAAVDHPPSPRRGPSRDGGDPGRREPVG